MKKLKFTLVMYLAFFCFKNSFSQVSQIIIDYQSWNPNNPACNVFGSGIDVPATLNSNSIILNHLSTIGSPSYDTNVKAVYLETNTVNLGDEFRITYNFKKYYRYKITIKALETNNDAVGTNLISSLTNNYSAGTGTTCNGPQTLASNNSPYKVQKRILSNSFKDYTFDFTSTPLNQDLSYLLITGSPVDGQDFIYINKITIEETAPTPYFTLSPTTLDIICGNEYTQNFTVTNYYNSPGTLSYNWNLGPNNGWMYAGSPAPSSFTTTSNQITLTHNASSTSASNVGVTVVYNGNNYSNLQCTTNNINPTFKIIGPSAICSGSGSYSIENGLPTGSSINWASSNPSVLSISSNGTATKFSDGTAIISAVINLPSGCSNTVNPISVIVGTPAPNGINGPNHDLCYNGRTSEIGTFYVNNPNTLLSYSWEIDGSVAGSSGGSGSNINVDPFRWEVGLHQIRVRSYSTCGTSNWFTSSFRIVDCTGGPRGGRSTISPNPADQTFTISNLAKDNISEIKIFDKSGRMIYQNKVISGSINSLLVPTQNIPNDIYIVKLFNGKEWKSEKVIIKH